MRFFLLHRSTVLIRLQSETLHLFSLVPYDHVRREDVVVVF